jgi:alcohol dehydrogenase class IV
MVNIIKKGLYRLLHRIIGAYAKSMTKQQPELLSGPGSIKKLGPILKNEGLSKAMVVTDKGLTNINLYDPMLKTFKENNIEYIIFDDVLPNPTIDMVETVKNSFLENKCDCMIGFGGGSVMDCAKIGLGLAYVPGKTVKDLGKLFKIKTDVPPFFAVPTTSGTGSETNFVGVITDPENREKFALGSKKLLPKYAILDPELTLGLPPYITSVTGMDALTHAVESYVNVIGDENSEENTIKACKMIFENLVSLYENGNQIEAREQMCLAAYHAGLTMLRAMLGHVHSIAHKLGGMYHVPHGLANAVILPHVLEYYGEKVHKELAKLAIAIGIGEESESISTLAEKFIQAIRDMNGKMNIPSSIKEIKDDDIDEIAETALGDTNPLLPVPKILGFDEIKDIVIKLKPN